MIPGRLKGLKLNPKFERMLISSSCVRLLRRVRNNAEKNKKRAIPSAFDEIAFFQFGIIWSTKCQEQ